MFNIKNRVYVTFPEEVNMIQDRVIILHPDYANVAFDVLADKNDPTSLGVVFKYSSLEELLTLRFNNNLVEFFAFLNGEQKLHIAATPADYAKLFALALMELQHEFGMSDAHANVLITKHRLKEYFAQSDGFEYILPGVNELPGLEAVFTQVKSDYTPTGALYAPSDVDVMPFELVFALYKWGYVTKDVANAKVAVLAEHLLKGQIQNLVESAKLVAGRSPIVFRAFLSDDTITTEDDIITAIEGNDILRRAFVTSDYDLNDPAMFAEIIRLCETIIANELDYDENPDKDLAEFNEFKNLFINKDIDLIDAAHYNMISTGFVSSRASKFNGLLLMHDYTAV